MRRRRMDGRQYRFDAKPLRPPHEVPTVDPVTAPLAQPNATVSSGWLSIGDESGGMCGAPALDAEQHTKQRIGERVEVLVARILRRSRSAEPPSLEELLRIAEGWEAGNGEAEVAAQRDVLASLTQDLRPER